jgi:hypothetical protein
MLFILLSIASFILRTLPIFEISDYDLLTIYTDQNRTKQIPVHNKYQQEIISSFDLIEWICMKKIFSEIIFDSFFLLGNSWFIFEITLRFIVAPSKRIFCTSILNWIGKSKRETSVVVFFLF